MLFIFILAVNLDRQPELRNIFMNSALRYLADIASKPQKTIIGLMSGTSLDGLDIALCEIKDTGRNTHIDLKQFCTVAYPDDVVDRIKAVASVDRVKLEDLCIAHDWLGRYHAGIILETLRDWSIAPEKIDCIASHGQTVYHAPFIQHRRQRMPNATLQIGDADHIARSTGILTLSDFRQKHIAAGGEGAPMAALVDDLLFRDKETDRLLLNIGGIANFTYLPSEESEDRCVTADTGPGNTLMNKAMQQYFDQPFDRDGKVAGSGTVHPELLKELMQHDYFNRPLPKTTGPEVFNLEWVSEIQRSTGTQNLSPEDLVATLTWFSAATIADEIKHLAKDPFPDIYLSGGGMHNRQLVHWLASLLKGARLHSFEEIGFNPDAKEAVSFAVLANETLSGDGFVIHPKQNTGRRVNFGKISLPV